MRLRHGTQHFEALECTVFWRNSEVNWIEDIVNTARIYKYLIDQKSARYDIISIISTDLHLGTANLSKNDNKTCDLETSFFIEITPTQSSK